MRGEVRMECGMGASFVRMGIVTSANVGCARPPPQRGFGRIRTRAGAAVGGARDLAACAFPIALLDCAAVFHSRPFAPGEFPMAIQKVGVVGCGLMGSGIAQVSAAAGFPTVVREVSPNALEKGLGMIHKFLKGGVEKGKLAQADMDRTLANLKGTTELKDFADCDLVVEAIVENLPAKRELFG